MKGEPWLESRFLLAMSGDLPSSVSERDSDTQHDSGVRTAEQDPPGGPRGGEEHLPLQSFSGQYPCCGEGDA